MEATCLVALAGLSSSGYSFDQNPEMVSYVKQVGILPVPSQNTSVPCHFGSLRGISFCNKWQLCLLYNVVIGIVLLKQVFKLQDEQFTSLYQKVTQKEVMLLDSACIERHSLPHYHHTYIIRVVS